MKLLKISIVVLVLFAACKSVKYKDLKDGVYADIQTNKGDILLELYAEKVPLTVANFVALAEGNHSKLVDSIKGKKFYDGTIFHRVIKDFMIQGGDPTGTGKGNAGYKFVDEFPKDSLGKFIYKHDGAGVLSMANSGKNSNSCQFFITHKPTPWLNGRHSIFGRVIFGQNVVDSIAKGDTINSIDIIRVGKKAKKYIASEVFDSELENAINNAKKAEKERFVKYLDAKKKFYAKKNVANAVKMPSGLQILTQKKGTGKKVTKVDDITMNYTIYTAAGELVQSTKGNTPFVFNMSKRKMIEGVTEAILKMRVGGKARLFIPYNMAYGEKGGGPFPPKSDVIFELEVLKVGK